VRDGNVAEFYLGSQKERNSLGELGLEERIRVLSWISEK
jgi:hypothetical protein